VRPSPPDFDDSHRLDAADFSRTRLVAFCGMSGSGKTTAIRRLCETHRDFCDRAAVVVAPAEAACAADRGALLVVEEVRRPSEVRQLWPALRRGATLLVASHVRPAWFAPLRLAAPIRTYAVDDDWRTIARHLERRGIPHTPEAVREYCRAYGANYVDADLIVERYPEESFDQALVQFQHHCRIQLAPTTNARA
jgi:hypothetical protein